ncbi:MAG TPA: M56 family metallopeptidase, partial [Thermoanaerobaculia bacterium]|nr:M56 family metallopeptidase [Thermoanaerobaculia bacterium]
MSSALVLALVLKVTLVLAAAWGLAALLRRRSAAARHDVWIAALLAAVALVALAPLLPALELPWVPAALGDARGHELAASDLSATVPNGDGPAAADPRQPISAADAQSRIATRPAPLAAESGHPLAAFAATAGRALGAASWPLVLWAAGIATVLLWCLAGHLGLRRLARIATPLDDESWRTLLAETADAAGVRRPVRLGASAAVGTPVTWGAWRPVVVLPVDAASWPLERRRAALLHELAHVA